jgi:hypothetical protein
MALVFNSTAFFLANSQLYFLSGVNLPDIHPVKVITAITKVLTGPNDKILAGCSMKNDKSFFPCTCPF